MANAILMASGLGERMRPLTLSTPKPLVKVGETPMIETVIAALNKVGVENIYIVIGYLGEQFNYLCSKYPNIALIENPDYRTINNISSIFYAKDKLLQGDCYIFESDLYISDDEILKNTPEYSCYFGRMQHGHSDDWVFDLGSDEYITRVGKAGDNCFNMVGISYFSANDAQTLCRAISDAYGKSGYEKLFWDDVVNANLDKLKLKV